MANLREEVAMRRLTVDDLSSALREYGSQGEARRRHELTQAQWQLIEPLLPARSWTGRPRSDDRDTLNGLLWILRTGAPWRDLPRRYGRWQTVHARFIARGGIRNMRRNLTWLKRAGYF